MGSIIATMKLTTGLLFDVGAEHGWMSAIFGMEIGGERMVLCEPSPEFWPNIRATWYGNSLDGPHACFNTFIAEETDWLGTTPDPFGWPDAAEGPECPAMAYRSLNHHREQIPAVSIDVISGLVGGPKGITIDVEGAESHVLSGALQTLRYHRPYVWCSIHPDLMEKDYGLNSDMIHPYMMEVGYDGRLLAVDHEEHWAFWPQEAKPL